MSEQARLAAAFESAARQQADQREEHQGSLRLVRGGDDPVDHVGQGIGDPLSDVIIGLALVRDGLMSARVTREQLVAMIDATLRAARDTVEYVRDLRDVS